MRVSLFMLFLLFAICRDACSQTRATENLILITLDGVRWQELFRGPDSSLLFNKRTVTDQSAISQFWRADPLERRSLLAPFITNVIGTEGQLYGNRDVDSYVDCANPHWFSYPGYSELLSGYVDRKIRSNRAVENPNATVLTYISQQPGFENSVAAFATWEVFPAILRERTDSLYVNAGHDLATGPVSEREILLNELQTFLPNPETARHDVFTFFYGFEYMKRVKPRVLYFAFDETDAYAHGGHYDEYLKALHRTDQLIELLWKWIQSEPSYKNKTTLLITTDHGRGAGYKFDKLGWRSHGRLAFGSGHTWMAVLGPDTPPSRGRQPNGQIYQKQVAKTAAGFLGLEYTADRSLGEVIQEMLVPENFLVTVPSSARVEKK